MGFRTDVRTRHVDFARTFSLLFLRQFARESRLDRESAVRQKAPSRRHRALKNAILRCPGLGYSGFFRAPP